MLPHFNAVDMEPRPVIRQVSHINGFNILFTLWGEFITMYVSSQPDALRSKDFNTLTFSHPINANREVQIHSRSNPSIQSVYPNPSIFLCGAYSDLDCKPFTFSIAPTAKEYAAEAYASNPRHLLRRIFDTFCDEIAHAIEAFNPERITHERITSQEHPPAFEAGIPSLRETVDLIRDTATDRNGLLFDISALVSDGCRIRTLTFGTILYDAFTRQIKELGEPFRIMQARDFMEQVDACSPLVDPNSPMYGNLHVVIPVESALTMDEADLRTLLDVTDHTASDEVASITFIAQEYGVSSIPMKESDRDTIRKVVDTLEHIKAFSERTAYHLTTTHAIEDMPLSILSKEDENFEAMLLAPPPEMSQEARQIVESLEDHPAPQNPYIIPIARDLVAELEGLMDESTGVAGLHLNGDIAPWDELRLGGCFERLTSLPALKALLETQRHALHLKTGNTYDMFGLVTDATNARRGNQMHLYQRDGKMYVRDVPEFEQKFGWNK